MYNQISKLTTETKKPTGDLPDQLAGLLKAGWSEYHIIRFARMRARYARCEYEVVLSPASSDFSPPAQLAFARWLYQNKRLFSWASYLFSRWQNGYAESQEVIFTSYRGERVLLENVS